MSLLHVSKIVNRSRIVANGVRLLGGVALLLLSVLTPAVFAQGPFGGETPPPGFMSAIARKVIESTADGSTSTAMYFMAMDNAEMRKDFGFTEEQNKKMKEVRTMIQTEMMKNIPKTMERFKNFSPDIEKELTAEVEAGLNKVRSALDAIVTTEQREKAKTLSFQVFGGLDSPVVNADMIATLNLSEEQKEKATALFKETEKERREIMEAGLKMMEKAVAAGGPNMSPEVREEIRQEGKALEGRMFASGKKLGAKIREFLTDAQMKQADELIANRPKYLGRLPRQLRPKTDAANEWKPTDSTWKPGDEKPADVPEKPRRFPTLQNGDENNDAEKAEPKERDQP